MYGSQTLIRESASGASDREKSRDLGESREGGPMKDHSRHESVGDSGVAVVVLEESGVALSFSEHVQAFAYLGRHRVHGVVLGARSRGGICSTEGLKAGDLELLS